MLCFPLTLTLFARCTLHGSIATCRCDRAEEIFRLQGRHVRVSLSRYDAMAFGGRVQQYVRAIEDQRGLKLLYKDHVHWHVGRYVLLRGDAWRVVMDEVDALPWAYQSSYTGYQEERLVDEVALRHQTRCGWCEVGYDRDAPAAPWIPGEDIYQWFCSEKCRLAKRRTVLAALRRKEMEHQWLRKGKKLLVETRRWLRNRKRSNREASA